MPKRRKQGPTQVGPRPAAWPVDRYLPREILELQTALEDLWLASDPPVAASIHLERKLGGQLDTQVYVSGSGSGFGSQAPAGAFTNDRLGREDTDEKDRFRGDLYRPILARYLDRLRKLAADIDLDTKHPKRRSAGCGCGRGVPKGARFCPWCGEALRRKAS